MSETVTLQIKGYSIKVLLSPGARRLSRAVRVAIQGIPAAVLSRHLSRRVSYELSLSLVNARTMQRLNRTYRKKNRPTDVLSFSGVESRIPVRAGPLSMGDVVVCASVARTQALENGVSLKKELARLTVHGVLHLFGYDHEKSRSEAKRMFELQEKILKDPSRR